MGKESQALEKFKELLDTPAAPIGLVGMSVAYQAQKSISDEISCYQTAYTDHVHSPFLHEVEERIQFRLTQCESLYKDELVPIAKFALEQVDKMKRKDEIETRARKLTSGAGHK